MFVFETSLSEMFYCWSVFGAGQKIKSLCIKESRIFTYLLTPTKIIRVFILNSLIVISRNKRKSTIFINNQRYVDARYIMYIINIGLPNREH